MNTLSTNSRIVSPEVSADLEALVFELVRERLLKAVGAGGMWTLQFRASTDTDTLFGQTISEYIARDIANQFSAPAVATVAENAVAENVVAEITVAEITVNATVIDNPEVENDLDGTLIESHPAVASEAVLAQLAANEISENVLDYLDEDTIVRTEWSILIAPPVAEPSIDRSAVVTDSEVDEYDEHRMFKPRKAA